MSMRKRMNKRGDIPVTILVLGVVVICVFAILSFFISNKSVNSSFSAVDAVEGASIIKEKISLYENLGYNKEEIKTILDLKEDSQGKIVVEQFDVKATTTVRFPWP